MKNAGPAARPLEFPMPTVQRGIRCTLRAYDHRSGKTHSVKNVLMTDHDAQEGYLIRKKVARSIYGVIRQCVVLKRRTRQQRQIASEDVEWESTDELVVIKVRRYWTRILSLFSVPTNAILLRFHHGLE